MIEPTQEGPHRGKPLEFMFKDLYSWRTGDWRIVYRIDGEKIAIFVITVGHGREVYDRLRSLLR